MTAPTSTTEPRRRRPFASADHVAGNKVARGLWLAGGFVAIGIGSVAVVVPGMPFLFFFVVAAWCFSHASPRFERWVLDLPKVGPLVRDYRAGLGMPRRTKIIAIASMWTAIVISSIVVRDRPWLSAVIVASGFVGTAVIWWRVPTKEEVTATGSSVEPQ